MAIYFLMLLILSWPATIFAQENVPEPQMNALEIPGPPPPGLVVPIDSGIVILLIAGLFFGVYMLSKYPRKV